MVFGASQKCFVLLCMLLVATKSREQKPETTAKIKYDTQVNRRGRFRGYACQIEDYDYYALISLETNDGKHHYCGGSLLSETHVLTSASCTAGYKNGYIMTLPTLHGSRWKYNENITIQTAMVHPGFNYRTKDYDYCVLGLSWKLEDDYSYVTLANAEVMKKLFSEDNNYVQVMGFENDLAEPQNPLIDFHCHSFLVSPSSQCLEDAEYERQSRFFCSYASPRRPEMANTGEIGGPVMYDHVQVGVLSDVIPEEVTLFARVDGVSGWINIHGAVRLRSSGASKRSIAVSALLVSVLISWYT